MAITTEVGGRLYTVAFHHERSGFIKVDRDGQYHVTEAIERPGEKSCRARTDCLIYEGAELARTGTAYCSWSDPFCKERGRLISLGRATKDYPEEVRKALMVAYGNRR